MTRDDIIRMAYEASDGVLSYDAEGRWILSEQEVIQLAALVAAKKEQQMIRDGYRKCAEGQRTTQFCGLLDAAVKAEREKVAAWMRSKSYATGHGDTVEDLLKELEWQVAEREREACAKVAESYEPTCDTCPSGVANAIRARGET